MNFEIKYFHEINGFQMAIPIYMNVLRTFYFRWQSQIAKWQSQFIQAGIETLKSKTRRYTFRAFTSCKTGLKRNRCCGRGVSTLKIYLVLDARVGLVEDLAWGLRYGV